jgi:hypothetical protein
MAEAAGVARGSAGQRGAMSSGLVQATLVPGSSGRWRGAANLAGGGGDEVGC